MLDADAVINNSFHKVGGSNAYPAPAPKKVGGSGPRKTHRIYAPDGGAVFDGGLWQRRGRGTERLRRQAARPASD